MIPDISITSADVKDAESHFGYSFSDPERLSILTCMETADIQACPGSGKTTLLAAKLYTLAKKWPYAHRGICVLSHTNVAREEIEKRVKGTVAEKILSYPHFVGTIQTFVDQFLGIPAAIELFGCRPEVIDDNRFSAIANIHAKLGGYNKIYGWADFKNPTSPRAIGRSSTIGGLTYKYNTENFCIRTRGPKLPSETTPTFGELFDLKTKLANIGMFTYRDMFELAQYYLFKHPQISEHLINRFPMLFIDEMQDTSSFQDIVLEKAFMSGKNSIVQRFGDPNQAIFEGGNSKPEPTSYCNNGRTPLEIRGSKRISPSIAKLTKPLCYKPQDISGNEEKPDCKHTIFLFDDNSIVDVKKEFCTLVKSECTDHNSIVAIGHTGESSNNKEENFPHDIRSYHPEFSKQRKSNRKSQRCFADHLQLARQEYAKTSSISVIRDRFIDAMLDALKLQSIVTSDGRPYTRKLLLEKLKNSSFSNENTPNLKNYFDCFQTSCYWYCCKLETNKPNCEIKDRVVSGLLKKVLRPIVQIDRWNNKSKSFWDENATDSDKSTKNVDSTVATSSSNTYFDDDTGLPLEFDTIHSVKGKTFSAILLLETLFNEHNLKSMLPFLTGEETFDMDSRPESNGQKKWDRNANRLRCSFVAMTRPTDLLCLAMRKADVEEIMYSNLKNAGWHIKDLTS